MSGHSQISRKCILQSRTVVQDNIIQLKSRLEFLQIILTIGHFRKHLLYYFCPEDIRLQQVPITLGPGPATQRPFCFYRLQLPSMGASIALLCHGKLWVRIPLLSITDLQETSQDFSSRRILTHNFSCHRGVMEAPMDGNCK